MNGTPNIKVIGIGGAGCNTISRLYKKGLSGVQLYAINTDAQALKKTKAPNKILIGRSTAGGLGAGMNCELGEKAIHENKEEIKKILEGAEIVFLTGGLGGGSGTPGLSLVGKIAREMNILTLSIATFPFSFEGGLRKRVANRGLKKIKEGVDSYMIIPNDRILELSNRDTSVEEAFYEVDELLIEAIAGISDILRSPGIISVDFADVEDILKSSGRALFGKGSAKGEERAASAVDKAFQSPLLDFSSKKAGGILFDVRGREVALSEMHWVANHIKNKMADSNTKIIFGVSEDEELNKGEIKVILIATGVR